MRKREVVAIWAVLAVVATEILVTYYRLPARELYHVSGSGIEGGASRVATFLNFPVALIAIALVAVTFEQISGRATRVLAVAAVLLCTPVFWPGVVSQANLDASWVNAPAVVGVAIAVVVSLRGGVVSVTSASGDRLRVALVVLVLLAAPEWFAADLGFFLNGVPVLGRLYQSGPYLKQLPGLPPFPPAVHHGHHHGMDGLLLVVTSLVLSRLLPAIRTRGLRLVTSAYVSLMLAYGLGNIANDFWIEQVNTRHWTRWVWPSVLEPGATWAWAVLVVAATAVWLAWFGREPVG